MRTYSRLVLNIPHSSALLPTGTKYEDMAQLLEDNSKWTDHYTDLLFLPPRPEPTGQNSPLSLLKILHRR